MAVYCARLIITHILEWSLIISYDLTWRRHIRHIKERVQKKCSWLRYIAGQARGIRPRTYLKLYLTCVRPLLEYCSAVWGPLLTVRQKKALQGLQSDVLRRMLRLPRYVPIWALHLETGLQLLETRWQKATLKLISTISAAENTRISRITMDHGCCLQKLNPMGKRRQPMDSDAIQRRDPSTSCSWRTRWNICIHKIPHAPPPNIWK